jgi:hypothetical protein
MKKTILLIIFFITNTSINLFAQQPLLEWERIYGGSENMNDNGTAIVSDKNGNVYFTGTVGVNPQAPTANIVTVKYNQSGTQQWVQQYDGPGLAESSYGIAIDSSSNIYVAGISGNLFNSKYVSVLLKYDSNGNLKWTKNYGDTNNACSIKDILVDRNNNILLTGSYAVSGSTSVFAIKYNQSGDTVWSFIYKEPGFQFNQGRTICIDSLNNYIIGGEVSIAGGPGDCIVLKLNNSGAFQWSKTYNSGGYNTVDVIEKVGVDLNNNIYAVGMTNYDHDFLTMKYSSIGSLIWYREYKGLVNGGSDYASSLGIDQNNNIIVTGSSQGLFGGGDFDVITIKYNIYGDSIWVRRFDTPNHLPEGARKLLIDNQSNIYILCRQDSINIKKTITLKYNINGQLIWQIDNVGEAVDFFRDINYNLFALENYYSDIKTVKYSQLIGIKEDKKLINNFIFNTFPNPFNNKIKIIVNLNKSSFVKINIYDITGKFIKNLYNNETNLKNLEISWLPISESSGIYFCELTINNENYTKIIVLNK